jgi:hypothetical protein
MQKGKHKKDSTTIKLSKRAVMLLADAKEHPRETYEDVILRLLKKDDKNGNIQ